MAEPQQRPLFSTSLLIAFAAHSLHGITLGLYTLVPVFVRQELDGTRALAGLIGGLMYGAGILARPLAGPLLDGVGRRWTLSGAALLAVISASIYPFIHTLGPLIYVARVLSGLADGMLFTGFFTYAADVVPPERRVQGLAVFGLSGLLPMSFAPLLGEWLIDTRGYSAMFYALLAATVGAFLISLFLPEPEDHAKHAQADPTRSSRGARITPSIVVLCGLAAAIGTCLSCALNFVPPAAREALTRIAWFTVPYGLMAAVVRLGGMNIPDRLGAATIAGPALIIYGLGLLLLAAGRDPWLLVISGSLGGIGHGIAFPALAALGAQAAPPGRRGMVLGLLTGLMDLFIFAPAWPLGRLGDVVGYSALFGAAGVVTLGTAVVWIWGVVVPGLARRTA